MSLVKFVDKNMKPTLMVFNNNMKYYIAKRITKNFLIIIFKDLSIPVDVYCDWVDACHEAN